MVRNKQSLFRILLAVLLVGSMVFSVMAESPSEAPDVTIQSLEEFLEFADHCKLDSYSKELSVALQCNLDLTNTDFSGIPIFTGTFDGGGHTVTGFSLKREGSVQGFFRYLTEDAVVRNLTLEGTLHAKGSQKYIGGIAGSNAGTIENCFFKGEISGNDCVGGIAGTNKITGKIRSCKTGGTMYGNHFVGGIAGENFGTVRSCSNYTSVNITAQENIVDLSDITIGTITGTESPHNVTDLGGIAGTSSGVIRECENYGDIGYRHMGYNIGGIAGSQKGYIEGCSNFAHIHGRKEVGGIVGQMEPISRIQYDADTLQILKQQLEVTSALANQTADHVHTNAQAISNQVDALQYHAENAKQAIDVLTPNLHDHKLPDPDTIRSAVQALSASISGMRSAAQAIHSLETQGTQSLIADIKALSAQIETMSQTLSQASDHLGGSITDVSDEDSPENLEGKVENCSNLGTVSGDVNCGGITGAIALENDLDPEDDFQFSGDESLNVHAKYRAVIKNCENKNTVSAMKRAAGGIVGLMDFGLVRECINTGSVLSESAEYVGGIAGRSSGYIRSCFVKSQLEGSMHVGGIAGTASVVTDCRSMTNILNGTEYLGCILGNYPKNEAEIPDPVTGNVYLQLPQDPGAIDGISYSGIAEPMTPDAFLVLEELPDVFHQVRILFRFEDGTQNEMILKPGQALDMEQVPPLPEKEGFTGKWKGLEDENLSCVYFDRILEAEYIPHRTVIESQEKRSSGKPILLAEGNFTEKAGLQLTALSEFPSVEGNVLEGWKIADISALSPKTLRAAVPEGNAPKEVTLMVLGSDGTWYSPDFRRDGSYLVFAPEKGCQAICFAAKPPVSPVIYILIGLAAAGAVTAAVVLIVRKKSRKKKSKAK